jgi:hypothetical protein
VSVVVVDTHGTLAEATVREASRESNGVLSAGLERVKVGADPEDVLSVRSAEVVVRSTPEGLVIDRLVLGGAEATVAHREGELAPEALARTTGARLRAIIATGRAAREQAEDADTRTWWERLGSDATVAVRDVTVKTRTDREPQTILQNLAGELQGGGTDGTMRLRGAGATGTGGMLRWDFRVDPAHVRGEGQLAFEGISFALIAPFLVDVPWHQPEDATLDGELSLRSESPERLAVRGRVHLENAAVESPRIAPGPVRGMSITVDGEGAWLPSARRLEIERGTIATGPEGAKAQVNLAGALEWAPDHYLIDVRATMPLTPCATAIGAIPRDLLDEAAGFRWRGSMGGRLEARIDSRDLEAAVFTVDIADGCTFTDVPAMADLRRFDGAFLHRVREPDGTTFEMTTGPGTGSWTPIQAISPYLIHAVLAHEDTGFFRHRGFTVTGIREALVRNLRAGRYVQGASTITMQLVKNVFLRREKTLARKVQEAILTWWMESSMPKQEILELYLNVIEYGPGVYGIRDASMHYFGRHPSELSPAEAVYLSTILPNPKRYHSAYERGAVSAPWKEKMRRILRRMGERGWYDAEAMNYGLAEVDRFTFHRDGAPSPPPRILPGRTGDLPIDGISDGGWGETDAEGWEEAFPEEGAPEDDSGEGG